MVYSPVFIANQFIYYGCITWNIWVRIELYVLEGSCHVFASTSIMSQEMFDIVVNGDVLRLTIKCNERNVVEEIGETNTFIPLTFDELDV